MKDKKLITEHNIDKVFAYFKKVIKNSKKMSSKELVSVFVGIIANHDEYYKHPTKKNTLVTPKGNVNIDGGKFDAFFSYFQKSYTPQEIAKFTEIADRLIEDTERRNSGDFWTPTLFCDYAHKMIGEELGEDWKENYVVWDCACGTKNLTRDYKFSNLYCSTLFDSELEMSKQYNKEATTFQFDFLNDPEDKLPESLIEHFKNNDPIMFFINPPYGKSTGQKNMTGGQTTTTKICAEMKKDKLDSSEFIKQFLYRICKIKENYNLTNVQVCCFTSPSWLMKPQSESFRKLWFKHFKFETGIMFQASEFADVSGQWGITFNLWSTGKQEQRNDFMHTLVKRNNDNEIEELEKKTLHNFDGVNVITTNRFIQNPNKNKVKAEKEIIYCTSPKTMTFEKGIEKVNNDYICSIDCPGNDCQSNQLCQISNRKIGCVGGNLALTKSNLLEASVVLALKSLIQTNWVIDKDQYNLNVDIPNQFKLDCLVYSTFTNYCMAYNLDGDRLKNEFFFMSKQEMEDLANTYSNQECYNDVHTDSDRYVYKYLQEHYNELSDDAKDILESARELVRKSFKYRAMFNEEEPKYQINNWDAGWYQIKALVKMYMPDDLKAFQNKYKTFANRLHPMVYEIGILPKLMVFQET